MYHPRRKPFQIRVDDDEHNNCDMRGERRKSGNWECGFGANRAPLGTHFEMETHSCPSSAQEKCFNPLPSDYFIESARGGGRAAVDISCTPLYMRHVLHEFFCKFTRLSEREIIFLHKYLKFKGRGKRIAMRGRGGRAMMIECSPRAHGGALSASAMSG